MFRRRKKLSKHEKFTNWIWPKIGWKKYGHYILLRLERLGGTPHSISVGVACGVAISFTPFVGFHFILAGITAWLFRGNLLASALGTAAGNPWTFPFIWVSTLYTGRWFLGDGKGEPVAFLKVFEKSMHSLITFDFHAFGSEVWPIIFPMMVGSLPFYILIWLITYYLVKRALKKIGHAKKGIRI